MKRRIIARSWPDFPPLPLRKKRPPFAVDENLAIIPPPNPANLKELKPQANNIATSTFLGA